MRDNLIVNVIGKQRIGKTTETRNEVLNAYVRGKKIIIFDPNDEIKLKYFTGGEIMLAAQRVVKSGGKVLLDLSEYRTAPKKVHYIPRLPYNCLEQDAETRVTYIAKFSKTKAFGIRRISPLLNAKAVDEGKTSSKVFMTIEQKNRTAKDILAFFRPTDAGLRNGFVFLDDINNYVLSMHNDEEFVGTLMNINHRGVDIVLHYHDPMQIPPVLYRFGSIIRLHKTVSRVKKSDKIPYEILKLAESIIDVAFVENPRFFIYIDAGEGKIIGATKEQFRAGALSFLYGHPTIWKEYGSKEKCIDQHLIQFLK